jgi:uroporphyrinogen-III synthase
MRIIITRPDDDARPLAEKLAALGHHGLFLPLLKIEVRDHAPIPDHGYQAVCITSANALKSAGAIAELKHIPIYAVGPQSLAAAKAAGFATAAAQGGQVEGLAAYLNAHLDPAAGPILYLAGNEVSADLQGLLQRRNFRVEKRVVYEAVPHTPPNAAAVIGAADAVLLYSPRSARLWHALVTAAAASAQAETLHHFCLSANVARDLPHNWRKSVASTPDETALLSLLDCQP